MIKNETKYGTAFEQEHYNSCIVEFPSRSSDTVLIKPNYVYDHRSYYENCTIQYFDTYILFHGYKNGFVDHEEDPGMFSYTIFENEYDQYCIKESDFYYARKWSNFFRKKKYLREGYYKEKKLNEVLYTFTNYIIVKK